MKFAQPLVVLKPYAFMSRDRRMFRHYHEKTGYISDSVSLCKVSMVGRVIVEDEIMKKVFLHPKRLKNTSQSQSVSSMALQGFN